MKENEFNKLIFKIKNKLFRRKSIEKYNLLNKNSKLSSDELDLYVLSKLNDIFRHSIKNVNYYKKSYNSIEFNYLSNYDEWRKLPVLHKYDIKNNTKDFISDGVSKRNIIKVTTGGSTGVPLTLYHDKSFPLEIIGWRMLKWWGMNPSDNIAFIYRKVRVGWKANLNALMWYPTKRAFLDASLMTSESMYIFYKKLNRMKPLILQGYVGGVLEFAKFCQKNNFELKFLKMVWVTSAPLSESSRNLMETVFNVPVYDQYGCSEVYWLGAECSKKEGLHVFSDLRYVEILDENDKKVPVGQYGDITITDLENYNFPLIRYKNGDRGRYLNHKCSCGLPFPVLDKIKGRITDIIKLESGKVISGDYLTTIFDDFPDAVEAFQIHQFMDYSIRLICVIGKINNAQKICEEKVSALRELTLNEVIVSLKLVDEIKHDQGKTRFIVSEIK